VSTECLSIGYNSVIGWPPAGGPWTRCALARAVCLCSPVVRDRAVGPGRAGRLPQRRADGRTTPATPEDWLERPGGRAGGRNAVAAGVGPPHSPTSKWFSGGRQSAAMTRTHDAPSPGAGESVRDGAVAGGPTRTAVLAGAGSRPGRRPSDADGAPPTPPTAHTTDPTTRPPASFDIMVAYVVRRTSFGDLGNPFLIIGGAVVYGMPQGVRRLDPRCSSKRRSRAVLGGRRADRGSPGCGRRLRHDYECPADGRAIVMPGVVALGKASLWWRPAGRSGRGAAGSGDPDAVTFRAESIE